jgi:hypothetical protein
MANVEKELHGAIYQRLINDPVVSSFVNGRVYDDVPASAVFPYVTIAPVDSVEDDADCITGLEVAQQIDCWSRAKGSLECKDLVDAVRATLHDYDLDLATNALVFFQCRSSAVRRDPDGITKHGILGFEGVIERH